MNLTHYTPVRVPYAHQIPFAGMGAISLSSQQAMVAPFLAASAKREAERKRNLILTGVAIAAGVGLLAYVVL